MDRDTDDRWFELHGKTRHVFVRQSHLIALIPPSDTGPNGDRTRLLLSNGQHILLDAPVGDLFEQIRKASEAMHRGIGVYEAPPASTFTPPNDPNVF